MALDVLAAVLVLIAGTSVTLAVLSQRATRPEEERLQRSNPLPRSDGFRAGQLLRKEAALPLLRRILSGSVWSERAASDLERAGLRLKVGEYLLARLLCGALGALLAIVVTGGGLAGMAIAIVIGLASFMVPALYVRIRAERRTTAISGQLVETLELIANALRSGFAFTQAVEMAAQQLSPPIVDELDRFLREVALGARMDDALLDMVARTNNYDLDIAVTAILVQRSTGGNLAEVLSGVAGTLRERERVKGEIRSLTAQQRLTGLVLAVYPVVLGLIFISLAPNYMSILWTDAAGRVALTAGIALQVLGVLVMRQILKLDY